MKSYQTHVSLLLLVALFFIVYPLQTTYAYFTDQTSVNGNLRLTTGTLALAEINPSAGVFEKNLQLETGTTIKNIGTLDGKLTMGTIIAKQNNQVLGNYQDYLSVTPKLANPTKLAAGESQALTVVFNKKKDWDQSRPIVIEIPIRMSQLNIAGDQSGFIDEKIYRITLVNNRVEEAEWPEFPGNGYVSQPLYHSVVEGKLTTVVPGVIYLKSDIQLGNPKEYFERTIKISGRQPLISKIDYVANKGYRLEIVHIEGQSHTLTNMTAMRVQFSGDYVHLKYDWGENTFSRAFIMESELRGQGPYYTEISETIEVNLLNSPSLQGYTAFNNEGGTKRLTDSAKDYIKNQLSIRTTSESHLKASFITTPVDKAYTGFQLAKGPANIQSYKGEKVQLVNKSTGKVVFERKVKHIPKTQKVLKEPSTMESRKETLTETGQTSTSSSQEKLIEVTPSSESETSNTETVESSTTTSEVESIPESLAGSQDEQIFDAAITSEVPIEKELATLPLESSSEEERALEE